MIHEPQPNAPTGFQDRDVAAPCAECDASVSDQVDAALNCARCGQSQLLCDDCMPKNLTERSRDATWLCPDCRARPFDS